MSLLGYSSVSTANEDLVPVYVLGKFNDEVLRVCTYEDDPNWISALSLKNKKISVYSYHVCIRSERKRKKT